MEKLLELLGQELYDQVIGKLGENSILVHTKDEKYILDDGTKIPKHRLDEVIEQKNSLKTQVDSYADQLKELKKSVKGNEELTQKISDLQKQNKDAEDAFIVKQTELQKSYAVKEALLDSGVTDSEARDLLLTKFKLDDIKLDENNKVKDFDSLVKPIKENKALSTLFGETKLKGLERIEQVKLKAGELLTFEQIESMSQEQVDANIDLVNKSLAGK